METYKLYTYLWQLEEQFEDTKGVNNQTPYNEDEEITQWPN